MLPSFPGDIRGAASSLLFKFRLQVCEIGDNMWLALYIVFSFFFLTHSHKEMINTLAVNHFLTEIL